MKSYVDLKLAEIKLAAESGGTVTCDTRYTVISDLINLIYFHASFPTVVPI